MLDSSLGVGMQRDFSCNSLRREKYSFHCRMEATTSLSAGNPLKAGSRTTCSLKQGLIASASTECDSMNR